jgi:uncharacterized membrane protein
LGCWTIQSVTYTVQFPLFYPCWRLYVRHDTTIPVFFVKFKALVLSVWPKVVILTLEPERKISLEKETLCIIL